MIRDTLMVQGTTSDAGKSTLVAGLARVMCRRGISVVPFKPQNMALNSAVTVDGGEIGRAQAVQAQACGLPPHTDMNPVLIKPTSDTGAQIIIHGQVLSDMDARDYHQYKTTAFTAVLESYERLKRQYDWVLVEGAGSPAEINLRDRDIANMGFAEAVDCPVVLIADIDRGGVFAHIVGTLALLSKSERNRTVATLINRFRGDIELLQPGIDWLESKTQKPVLGTLPYLKGFYLEAEDGLDRQIMMANRQDKLKVLVPALPHISNHTDFDPLRLHPQVEFRYLGPNERWPDADLVILPGSKNVRADLLWVKEQDWINPLTRHLRYGGKLIGICGGYQMLGRQIDDPYGVEGAPGKVEGLGFLNIDTTLEKRKQLARVKGKLFLDNVGVDGYEIHMGVSAAFGYVSPAVTQLKSHVTARDDDRPNVPNNGLADDGAVSPCGQIFGTYLHGLFDRQEALTAVLRWSGLQQVESFNIQQFKEQQIDRLADCIEQTIAVDRLLEWLDSPRVS